LKPGQLVFVDKTIHARDNPNIVILQGFFKTPVPGVEKLESKWGNGALAEKVLVPIECVYPIPESLLERYTPAQLTNLNTLSIAIGGLVEGGFEPGVPVMIHPATGHFGSAAVVGAVAMGASAVYAVGRKRDVLEQYVKKLGNRVKPVVIKGDDSDKEVYGRIKVNQIQNWNPPKAPMDGLTHAISSLKHGGTLMLSGGNGGNVSIPYMQMVAMNLTVKGNLMFAPSIISKVCGLIESGLLDLSVFEVKSFKLDQIHDALDYAESDGNRSWLYEVVFEP
jgi:alcohol dehydrogenase